MRLRDQPRRRRTRLPGLRHHRAHPRRLPVGAHQADEHPDAGGRAGRLPTGPLPRARIRRPRLLAQAGRRAGRRGADPRAGRAGLRQPARHDPGDPAPRGLRAGLRWRAGARPARRGGPGHPDPHDHRADREGDQPPGLPARGVPASAHLPGRRQGGHARRRGPHRVLRAPGGRARAQDGRQGRRDGLPDHRGLREGHPGAAGPARAHVRPAGAGAGAALHRGPHAPAHPHGGALRPFRPGRQRGGARRLHERPVRGPGRGLRPARPAVQGGRAGGGRHGLRAARGHAGP